MAQENFSEILKKGNWMVGGTISFSNQQFSDFETDLNQQSLFIDLKCGPFNDSKGLIGLKLNSQLISNSSNDQSQVFAGVFWRKYKPIGDYRW